MEAAFWAAISGCARLPEPVLLPCAERRDAKEEELAEKVRDRLGERRAGNHPKVIRVG